MKKLKIKIIVANYYSFFLLKALLHLTIVIFILSATSWRNGIS